MNEQDQTIRSLPDGLRRISEAYRLFELFIKQIKTVQSLRLQGRTIVSLATNTFEDDFENKAKRAKRLRGNALVNFEAAFKRLRDLHGRLPEAFVPVFPMLKHSLRPLGKFHFEGTEGNHAFWFIDQLFYRAEEWASLVENLMSLDLEIPIAPRVTDRISEIEKGLPLSMENEIALLDRLALEESQLQRDLPKYAEIIGVKEKKPETVFEIVQEVERAYDLAFSMVSRLRFAECFATQAAEMTAVAFIEGEDEERSIAEAIAQAKGKLFDRRWALIDLRFQIDADLKELREAFLGVTNEVFGFSYEDTKDFEETGDPSVYASLTKVTHSTLRWIGETIGFLSMVEQLPIKIDQDLRAKCDALAEGFPMNREFEQAIRKRILFEKSVLTRNAKAFAESRGIIGSTTATTPKGREKKEKTLSKAEDQLTLAAAVWLHYRDLAESKDKKIVKKDVLSIAKQLGFKGTYREFQSKSNSGTKGPYKEATIRRMKEINFPTETSFLGDL